MKFFNVGKEERLLLLKALDVNSKNLVCELCKKKTSVEKCCILPPLPPFKKNKHATILCESLLCMSEYFTKQEELCESCGEINSQVVLNDDVEYKLCHNCLLMLVNRNLDKDRWARLSHVHGDKAFLLHDDFYDEEGRALQPHV